MEILRLFGFRCQQVSIDEAFLEISLLVVFLRRRNWRNK